MALAVARADVQRAAECIERYLNRGIEAEDLAAARLVVNFDASESTCPACLGKIPQGARRCPSCKLRFF